MPTFKVTLIIDDQLALGHVLSTKGVELVSIQDEHKMRKQFHHHSGKTGPDFALEYMQGKDEVSWAELNKMLVDTGFAGSTVNNVVFRLQQTGKIVKLSTGLYKLVE